MSDDLPSGALVSFGGTTIGAYQVAMPTLAAQAAKTTEATLGLFPVDLYGTAAPSAERTLTVQVLLRAADSSTTPWTDLMTAYNALRALPWTGALVLKKSPETTDTLSAPARRGDLPLDITPANARHLLVSLSFQLLGSFA